MPRVFLCVSIDCECDKGPAWRVQRPRSFEGVYTGIGERLHPLFRRFGAKPTYLLSPELLRDERCVDRLASLEGCELGAHLHGEMADPGAFDADVTSEVQRDYAPDVERAKMQWTTRAFRDAFGRAPASFRAGRFGVGPHTFGILESLGYAVDSSVTPHVDWSGVSPGLSFAGSPAQPHRPEGARTLLEVPVTIRAPRAARVPVVGRFAEPRWLRPTKTGGDALVAIAREEIAEASRARPHAPVVLNAMLHNVEVVAGASPYAADDASARRILDALGALLDFAQRSEIASVSLADVAEIVGRHA